MLPPDSDILEVTNCFPYAHDDDDQGFQDCACWTRSYAHFYFTFDEEECRVCLGTVCLLMCAHVCWVFINSYPIADEYQIAMMRSLRDVNLDHLQVGWYQVLEIYQCFPFEAYCCSRRKSGRL